MTRCGQEETGQPDEGSQDPRMQGTRDTFPGTGMAVPVYDGDGLHLIFRLFAMLRCFVYLQNIYLAFCCPWYEECFREMEKGKQSDNSHIK